MAAFESISATTFGYIDWISQQVIDAYESERERWVENRNSVRAVRVRELLDVADEHIGTIDVDATTTAIRYPLRRTHLALILWSGADGQAGRELSGLEQFLRKLAGSLELEDEPLFVAADRVSAWGWLALGGSAPADPVASIRAFVAEAVDSPFVAVGSAMSGVDGFRRSHVQAQNARRVAVTGTLRRRVTAAADPGVGAAALLTEDLAQTRWWVSETLGTLSCDTDTDARLRETLRVFLGVGSSYKAAAEKLNLHHNSVKYRVDRAVERRGRAIAADRIDVELALLACHHFGDLVLRSP